MLTLTAPASGRLSARNPVATLGAAAVPGLALVLTLDPLTPAVVLLLTLLAVPASGVPWPTLLRRARPLLVAAVAVGTVNALVGVQDGPLLLALGPVELTRPDALTGLGIALRVLGIALPGVLVLAATDPVDLADALVQTARLPARLAYGVLAALRLLPLLAEDWQHLARARRARGVATRGLRPFAGQVLGLLVLAIRRATRLAEAMDARGFASGLPRTAARVQRLTPADVVLVAGSVAGTALAVAVSVLAGAWDPLLG